MAAPSGVLDGNPRWFEIGQMTTDPGLDRTAFGIPVNCAGAEPGVYCAGGAGMPSDWRLLDLLGNIVGYASYYPPSNLWPITDLAHNPNGVMECYNYNTVEDPIWALSVVTNLWTGEPGQFKPYPLNATGDNILFQSITTTIGPAVGRIIRTA